MKKAFLAAFLSLVIFSSGCLAAGVRYAVVVSANAEWKIVRKNFPGERYIQSPWGEYFVTEINIGGKKIRVLYFHEGWGKVAAAGATQYVINRFDPEYLINIGTCGGFEGKTQILEVILVDKSVIYDIREAMGDSKEAIADYSTEIDLSWIDENKLPVRVTRSMMVSADRDLVPSEIPELGRLYGAIAGDWETGAIAYVCKRNGKKVLILRGVTDIVSTESGEAYNNFSLFEYRTDLVMSKLLGLVPGLIALIENGRK